VSPFPPPRGAVVTPVDSILSRLLALHPKRIDLSLDRVWHILERLGHPQRRVPPVIHVAGTNGKGSTVAFLRAMLEAAGKSVHVYTSPNLVRVNERFRLGAPGGGKLVSDDELADALAECERANETSPITIFEFEKAGIFRKSVPAVIAPQAQAVSGVLEREAERMRAPIHAAGQQWTSHLEHGRLV